MLFSASSSLNTTIEAHFSRYYSTTAEAYSQDHGMFSFLDDRVTSIEKDRYIRYIIKI